ncbi:MAG: helix-turn-helix domain-containing protein [Candidatus Bathyarchaeia archaeon]
MLVQGEPVETLVKLGLTFLQAKVYLALAILGTSTGRTTAKSAKVASQDVYRVLTELQEKSLVEKIISKPNKYRPIPLEEGISMLIQRRDKQTAELKKTVFEILKSFQSVDKREDKNETGDFVLIPEKEPIENSFIRVWETAQTSIDLMDEDQERIRMLAHRKNYELMVKALKKGVKIREIHNKTQKGNQPKLFSALLKREPEFQARYLHFPSPAKVIIKDNTEVFISTTSKVNTLEQPYLWSNNPILVQVIQQWYDIMWEKCSGECQRVQ